MVKKQRPKVIYRDISKDLNDPEIDEYVVEKVIRSLFHLKANRGHGDYGVRGFFTVNYKKENKK